MVFINEKDQIQVCQCLTTVNDLLDMNMNFPLIQYIEQSVESENIMDMFSTFLP